MTTATSGMPRCCAERATARSPTKGYDQMLPHVVDVVLACQAIFWVVVESTAFVFQCKPIAQRFGPLLGCMRSIKIP